MKAKKTHVITFSKRGIKKYLVRVKVPGVSKGEINSIGGYFYMTDFKKNATPYTEKGAQKILKLLEREAGAEYSTEPLNN